MELTPNPERASVRQDLAKARRLSFGAFKMWKKSGSQQARAEYLVHRKNVSRFSRELAKIPPFTNAQGIPSDVIPNGHFRRFRHSGRFKKFFKVWYEGRRKWKRKSN